MQHICTFVNNNDKTIVKSKSVYNLNNYKNIKNIKTDSYYSKNLFKNISISSNNNAFIFNNISKSNSIRTYSVKRDNTNFNNKEIKNKSKNINDVKKNNIKKNNIDIYNKKTTNEKRNILVTIKYDGTPYHGWQIQNNALTVQEVFQNALYKVLNKKVDIKGCSRTDSKVHANMYCISFITDHKIPTKNIKPALNRFLPYSVVVLNCKEVPLSFHGRYSCIGKEYIYKIWNSSERNPFLENYAYHYKYKIDENLLNKAAQGFVGTYDYTSFCTLDKSRRESTLSDNMIKTVKNFSVTRKEDMVYMCVEADAFLYNMVRIMVGTLFRVHQGKIPYNKIKDIINKKNRKYAGPTSPAHGLYLNKVKY